MADKRTLREQIREAGGFYNWANTTLIRFAGPPSVGKLTDYTPPPCDRCHRQKSEHIENPDGSLSCPTTDAR